MKKAHLLFITIIALLLGGCTIVYEDLPTPPIENPAPEEPNPDNDPPEEPNPDNDPPIVPPSTSVTIDPAAKFYPSTLSSSSQIVKEYSYIDANLKTKYKIYSAYYSEYYDTIYIAYDLVSSPVQTLKAKDLHEIEQHAINYFVSDSNRSEDKNYLKAVRIYPDRLASSCRKNLSDNEANRINGCADYGGKEAIIELNITTSLEDFYNTRKVYSTPVTYTEYEPMRDTFAHEYGHISTFYHMVYKNDENYEDYLKLRLGSYYNTIYPSGLPSNYSSGTSYEIQPEEILADDFVELFYNTIEKKDNDTYEYTLNYEDSRNSLGDYKAVQKLKNNQTLYNTVRTYYYKFLNYSNRTTYSKPIIISSGSRSINYYESYSQIGINEKLKTIISKIDVNLIAVGEVTIDGNKYYRVILSNTFKCPGNYCDKKDVGEKFGYVQSSNYTKNNSLKLYKLDRSGNSSLSKNSILPIENNTTNNLFVIPFYDFAYVLNTTNNMNYATMYDYLTQDLKLTQTYKINIYSFATLIQ